jgi:hypothetical protein
MPFDPWSWSVGYLSTRAANGLLGAWLSNDLPNKLRKTVTTWTKSLPPGYSVVPEALFPHDGPQAPAARPELRHLSETLGSHLVPSSDEWFAALREQWLTIRQALGPNAQALFQRKETEVEPYLRRLAEELHTTSAQDEALFRPTVIRMIERLHSMYEERWDRLLEYQTRATRKEYRPIDSVLLSVPEEPQEFMTRVVHSLLASALYVAYSSLPFRAFRSAIAVSQRERKGIVYLEYDIMTGEARFASVLREHKKMFAKALGHEPNSRWGELAAMLDVWDIRSTLPAGTGWYSARLAYDRDARRVTIDAASRVTQTIVVGPDMTAGDGICAAATLATNFGVVIVKADKGMHPAFAKMYVDVADNHTVRFGKIMTNVHDPDDWDYALDLPVD